VQRTQPRCPLWTVLARMWRGRTAAPSPISLSARTPAPRRDGSPPAATSLLLSSSGVVDQPLVDRAEGVSRSATQLTTARCGDGRGPPVGLDEVEAVADGEPRGRPGGLGSGRRAAGGRAELGAGGLQRGHVRVEFASESGSRSAVRCSSRAWPVGVGTPVPTWIRVPDGRRRRTVLPHQMNRPATGGEIRRAGAARAGRPRRTGPTVADGLAAAVLAVHSRGTRPGQRRFRRMSTRGKPPLTAVVSAALVKPASWKSLRVPT
jgi:hypothetical protein